MGNSYHGTGSGTIGWVDKVVIGSVTYDFVLARYWYVSPTGSDTNEGTLVSPFLTIQKAIGSASAGDAIYVAAGTYVETGQIVIDRICRLWVKIKRQRSSNLPKILAILEI